MRTVLAIGTFDVFHKGHGYYLTEAKKLGDRLVVVVARDSNVERIKGLRPHDNEEERLAAVQKFTAVDEARLGYEEWGKHLQILEDVQPQIIAMGYDQKGTIPDGPWNVVRIDAFEPEKYKSSIIRKNKI